MSICSAHQTPDPNCRLCQIKAEDVLPNYAEKKAKAAGKHTCKCGFVYYYYKTTDRCPLCGVSHVSSADRSIVCGGVIGGAALLGGAIGVTYFGVVGAIVGSIVGALVGGSL